MARAVCPSFAKLLYATSMDEVDNVAFIFGLAIVYCTTFLALLKKRKKLNVKNDEDQYG